MNRETLAAFYLDWVNNYLTLEAFAEAYGLTATEAAFVLHAAQSCHENPHPEA